MYPKSLSEIPHRETRQRIGIERRIVNRLIDDALAADYELQVYDGEELHPWTRDKAKVVEAIMNTDEDRVYCRKDGVAGWVFFVYGNDGWDVICDYTVNLEDLIAPVNDFAETLEDS